MSDDLFIPLKLGKTYLVCDHYGDVAFEAVYRGLLEDENHVNDEDTLLLFEKGKRKDPGYRWAGVTPEVGIGRPDGLFIHLVAHHYGNSPETITHCCSSTRGEPKWVPKILPTL